MSIVNVTGADFEREVLNSDKTVLVDFWASWCGPCRMVAPIVDEIAGERDDIKVCKVNVDEQQELAAAYDIMSVPTFMVMKDGLMIKKASGAMPKQEILGMLQ